MEEIIFHVLSDIKKTKPMVHVQCSEKENQTLKEAIEMQQPPVLSCPINQYIFKAKVEGHSGQVVVNPNILCGWLERGTNVQTHKLSESKANKLPKPQVQIENVSSLVSNQTLFLLNIDRPPNSCEITHVPHGGYKVEYLCVSAVRDKTLLEALEKDGRFKEPEKWTLNCGKSDVSVFTKACQCENYIFNVEYNARRRTSSRLSGESVSKSGTNPNVQIKKEKLEEDEVKDASSPSPMSAKYTSPVNSFHQTILESAKSHVNRLLEGTRCKNTKKLATLIEEQFSKPIDQSKSVWLMEELVSASKSVGRIYAEGCPGGTCFLIKEDVILTNYHVYADIREFIAGCRDNPQVKVSFNHVRQNQTSNFDEVEVNMEDIRAQCEDKSLDYIFLGLRGKRDHPALGERISIVDPKNFTNEIVTIIGHPDGREKQMDTDCRIISQHIWRSELLDRIQKPQPFEFIPLFTCKKKISSDDYKHKIAYDSSFFYGASGSPVFDDQGRVIAMHTSGWVEKSAGIKWYVMEFAIPIDAIYNDCYYKDSNVANMLFPSFSMNVD